MFNVLRIAEGETDSGDRPLDPVKLLGIEILSNPFDDIYPRYVSCASLLTHLPKVRCSAKAVPARAPVESMPGPTVLAKGLLSFGDEEEEDGAGGGGGGGRVAPVLSACYACALALLY